MVRSNGWTTWRAEEARLVFCSHHFFERAERVRVNHQVALSERKFWSRAAFSKTQFNAPYACLKMQFVFENAVQALLLSLLPFYYFNNNVFGNMHWLELAGFKQSKCVNKAIVCLEAFLTIGSKYYIYSFKLQLFFTICFIFSSFCILVWLPVAIEGFAVEISCSFYCFFGFYASRCSFSRSLLR